MDTLPLVTLVKQRTVDETHVIEEQSEALDRTLSMLCSFLSVEDLASFLFSPSFAAYARTEDPWLVFELGLYADHTKTLELVPSAGQLLFADPTMTVPWSEAVAACERPEQVVAALSVWLDHVTAIQ